ncbi:hypothetical protein J6590_022247 [Homalodisca vitripennis]|nr:hypothetical protein J6590_022247 [Homalodisca vitripennis]
MSFTHSFYFFKENYNLSFGKPQVNKCSSAYVFFSALCPRGVYTIENKLANEKAERDPPCNPTIPWFPLHEFSAHAYKPLPPASPLHLSLCSPAFEEMADNQEYEMNNGDFSQDVGGEEYQDDQMNGEGQNGTGENNASTGPGRDDDSFKALTHCGSLTSWARHAAAGPNCTMTSSARKSGLLLSFPQSSSSNV